MKVDTRRRIPVTDTPRVSALIQRNARPGEGRATTLVRLAEQGEMVEPPRKTIRVFASGRHVTEDLIDAIIEGDDLRLAGVQ